MKIEKTIKQEIRRLRTDVLSLTQKQLAKKLNVSVVYISYLEIGKKLPSVKVLKKIYRYAKYSNIPDETMEMLYSEKNALKESNFSISNMNTIYRLQENGMYSLKKLKKLLKDQPDNICAIYGLLGLLLKEKKIEDAKKFLLDNISNLKSSEERKILEASYFEIDRNYESAIKVIEKALKSFSESDQKNDSLKANLYFQASVMYFKFGQFLYKKDNNKSIDLFKKALNYHDELRKIDFDPFQQMDYANIFFWLGLLGYKPKKNFEQYIIEIKKAFILNSDEYLKSKEKKKGLFSNSFITLSISFLIRTYAELASLENDIEKKLSFLFEADLLISKNIIYENINPKKSFYYRYCFNLSGYFSIKSMVYHKLDKDFQTTLDKSDFFLNKALEIDLANNLNKVFSEIEESSSLSFYRKNRPREFNSIKNRCLN